MPRQGEAKPPPKEKRERMFSLEPPKKCDGFLSLYHTGEKKKEGKIVDSSSPNPCKKFFATMKYKEIFP
jgi:hypothetical protein